MLCADRVMCFVRWVNQSSLPLVSLDLIGPLGLLTSLLLTLTGLTSSVSAMAHRQLADKYAKQLDRANQRIIELETTVANCEDRLECATVNNLAASSGIVNEDDNLSAQLDRATGPQ